MKSKTKLKLIAICLIFTFFSNMTVLAVGSSAAGTVEKFSESLSAKLATATKKEKISAYVFFNDNSESVLTTMKDAHPELFATYTTAKGITVAAADQKTETQRTATVDGAKLQEAIEVKRQLYKNHYTTANSAVLEKHCEEADILFVSAYAPMAIVNGTVAELKALALDTSVERIDLFENHEVIMPLEDDTNPDDEIPPYIEEHWNLNSRAEYTRDALGLTGAGVKIGQVEQGLPYVEDPYLDDATIITNEDFGDDMWWTHENHATNVARIMVGTHGIAPDATLYSACVGDAGRVYHAIEWLISQGVNVINMSMTLPSHSYDDFCAFVDHIAVQHDVHFVAAVGNLPVEDVFGNILIRSPAWAYNAIIVGAYDDRNSVPANDSQIIEKQEDDALLNESMYIESTSLYVDYNNKPHLLATGNYFWGDYDANGTSYAAPQVTGVIAQLCSYDSTLKAKQSSMAAILMASCGRKILNIDEVNFTDLIETYYEFKGGEFYGNYCIPDSNNQISDRQGVGKLDAYWAYTIAANDNFWSLTLGSSATTYEKSVYITASSETLIRISAFWLRPNSLNHSNELANDVPETTQLPVPNWDIVVYGPNNQIIAESETQYNNYEVVQFRPTTSGIYRIELTRPASSENPLSYVGLAMGEL